MCSILEQNYLADYVLKWNIMDMHPFELKQETGATWKEIANACGLKSHSAAMKWQKVPAQYLLRIEARFGVPRERLRPDLYAPRRKGDRV